MSRLLRFSLVSITRWCLMYLCLILLVLLGVDLMFQDAGFRAAYEGIVDWVPLTRLDRVPFLVLGAMTVVLPALYVAAWAIEARLERGIVGRGRDGADICLAPEAIERAVVREVRADVEEVQSVRACRAVQGRRGPTVTVQVVVSDRRPVPEVQQKVRTVVEGVLTRMIGFADGATIRVLVREVAGAAAPASRGSKPARRRQPASEAEA